MKTQITWFDRIMAALTFAEANEHEVGKEFITGTALTSEKEQNSAERDAVITSDLQGAEVAS